MIRRRTIIGVGGKDLLVPGPKTKKEKRKATPPPEGFTVTSQRFQISILEEIRAVLKTLHQDPKNHITQSELVEELVVRGLLLTDRQTGKQKSSQKVMFPPSSLRHFASFANCNMDDDLALFAEADRFWHMVWITDAPHNCVHVNPVIVNYTGLPLGNNLAQGWTILIHPDDVGAVIENGARSIKTHEPWQHIYRLRCRNGEWCLVRDWGIPRYRTDGTFAGFVGTIHEVPPPDSQVDLASYDGGVWNRGRGQALAGAGLSAAYEQRLLDLISNYDLLCETKAN